MSLKIEACKPLIFYWTCSTRFASGGSSNKSDQLNYQACRGQWRSSWIVWLCFALESSSTVLCLLLYFVWIAVLLFTSFIYTQATAQCSWNVMLVGCAYLRLVSPLNLQTLKYLCILCCPISGSAVLFGRFPGVTRLSFWYGQIICWWRWVLSTRAVILAGENPQCLGKILTRCHFAYHRSHVD